MLTTLCLLFLSPADFLPSLLEGASKSATLCLSLLSTYAVWLGLMRLWEDSGLSRRFSKRLRPCLSRVFHTKNQACLDAVCMNVSVNMLGISGAGTPYGITASKLLGQERDADFPLTLFFVLNATSLQIIPTSIIGIRTALGSANPTAIVLPTFLSSLFSTLLGVALTYLSFGILGVKKKGIFKKRAGQV